MDIVYLHGIEVDCVIGVLDWEREISQRLLIDVDLGCDLHAAGQSDELADTLDYDAISSSIRSYCIKRQAKLVESLAAGIADLVLTSYECPWCRVTINKPGAVRGINALGVTIERGERA